MTKVEERLKELGIELPPCPVPVAAYCPAQIVGNIIFVSGNTAYVGDELKYAGKVGLQVSQEEAYESAKICAIRCLSGLKSVADLDKIRIIQVSGYVNAIPEFEKHPAVINGASELIEKVFSEKGKHARKAIGVNSLPDNASVELELVAILEE